MFEVISELYERAGEVSRSAPEAAYQGLGLRAVLRLAAPADFLRGFYVAGAAAADSPRSCAMMAGFSNVEMSCVISSPRASARSSRRMILPERVLGSTSAKRMSSGLAMAPSCLPTHSR